MRIARAGVLGVLGAALAAGCDGNINDGSIALVVTSRVSVGTGNVESLAPSQNPSVSADGRFVAFESRSPNIHPDDTDVLSDIYVHDRVTGALYLASRGDGPAGPKADEPCLNPSISADGRYVAFDTFAGNLHADDRDAVRSVYVRDIVDHVTYFASRETATTTDPEGTVIPTDSFGPSISGDGRFVAFETDTFLGPRTIRRAVFDFVTLRVNFAIGVGVDAREPSISGDGRIVAFTTDWSFDVDDVSGHDDVYVWHVDAGTVTLVSRPSGPAGEGDGPSRRPRVSLNGQYVAFESDATNLVPTGLDANGVTDVFLRDLADHVTVRASVASSGVEATSASTRPSVSGDGRHVAFVSAASNLVNDDLNAREDVFIRDTRHGGDSGPRLTVRASVRTYGEETSDHSGAPAVAANGAAIAFHSQSTNMVEGDANGAQDVFVRAPLPWQDVQWDEAALALAGFGRVVVDPDNAVDDGAVSIALRSSQLIAAGWQTIGAGDTAWRLQKMWHATGAPSDFTTSPDGPAVITDLGSGDDRPTAVVMDAFNVYTVGYTSTAASGRQWVVQKMGWDNGIADSGWGPSGEGHWIESYSAGDDVPRAAAVDDSGFYVVGGDAASGSLQWRLERRDLIDGTTVAAGGWELVENPGAGPDEALAIAIDAEHMYVAGYDTFSGNPRWRIEKRLLVDGSLVPGFGTGGVVVIDPSAADDRATAVAITHTHLFVAGYDETQGPGNRRWGVLKLRLDDGTPAAGFGAGGAVVSDPTTADDEPRWIAVDTNGLFIVGMENSGDRWRLERRRTDDGSLLPSAFGPAVRTVDSNPGQVDDLLGLASDGNFIYLAGTEPRGAGPLRWVIEKRRK